MLPKKQSNFSWSGFILLLFLVVFLFLFDTFNFILVPIQRFFLNSADWFNFKVKYWEIPSDFVEENKRLKQEINNLLLENSQLKIYQEENITLRESLNFFETKIKDRSFSVARVIAKDFNNNSVVTINKGKKDGLVLGLPVLVSNGILVGKVTEVYDNYSKFVFLRDSSSVISGKILNKSKLSHLIQGKYGLSIIVDLIDKSIDIKEGDVIITDGLEQYIPSGLLVGQIIKIEDSPNRLFNSALLKPSVSYDDLSLVSVLLPEN